MNKLKIFANNLKGDVVAHLPQILAGSGAACVILGSFGLCKASFKAVDVLKEHEEATKEVREKEYENEKDRGRDLTAIYKRTCCKLGGYYAAPIIMIVGGVTLSLSGTIVSNQRETKAWGVAAATSATFNQYRSRVVDKMGEEADRRFMTGEEEVETTETVTVKGKEKTVKKSQFVADPNALGIRYIIPGNPLYDDMDKVTLEQVQAEAAYFQRMMISGYLKRVTLNQIYERLHLTSNAYDPSDLILGWQKGFDDPKDIRIDCWTTTLPGEDGKITKVYAVEIKPARDLLNGTQLN